MLKFTARPLFYKDFFNIFFAPHSFSVLKNLIRILPSLLIVPVYQLGIKHECMTTVSVVHDACVEYLTDGIFNNT